MKALVKAEAAPGLTMKDIPEPTIGPNDVLIKTRRTAICGTDMHIWHWDEWAQRTVPVPMQVGHEYGVNRPGCFAEYLSLPAANVFKLSPGIDDELASILDPLGNATHTALSFSVVGEDVLITGAGPIGIMAVAIAKHVGARHVVITDVNDYRLDLARQMGATRAVNVSREKLDDVVKDLGMEEGFDVGMEMSGNPHAFRDLLRTMNHGGSVALLGIMPENTGISWDEVIFKGLNMKGVYGREMFETWYKMAAMLQSGLNIRPIITHRLPVADFREGFEIMSSGKSGKVILDWAA